MIDQLTDMTYSYTSMYRDFPYDIPLDNPNTTFTRSNGTVFSRIYERLTKASRRSPEVPALNEGGRFGAIESAYRAGVKDTLEALRAELS
jgi:hypothetical protein